MLFRFGGEDGDLLGGRATTLAGSDFAPGTDHEARIDFWADDVAREIVRPGEGFTVWYAGDIGSGMVEAVE
ncbi:MAG: hypothetical protein LC792_09830 [Actinobacteria bacterium]|nr:hypothetical protein [Actinomycetota bacterium]